MVLRPYTWWWSGDDKGCLESTRVNFKVNFKVKVGRDCMFQGTPARVYLWDRILKMFKYIHSLIN